MELADFISVIKKHLKASLLLSFILATIAFVGSFYVPIRYRAEAMLFVNREVAQASYNYFSYEGFYAIQTAEKYTDTVLGLLRSEDIKKLAEKYLRGNFKSGVFRDSDIRLFEKSIMVKRVGPQIISVSVMGRDKSRAANAWSTLAQTLIDESKRLNASGDNKLSVEIVGLSPVVEEVRTVPLVNAFVAFLLGLLVCVVFLSFKRYLEK